MIQENNLFILMFILVVTMVVLVKGRIIKFKKQKNMADKILESERLENEANVMLGIKSQATYTLAYITEVVNRLVTDVDVAAAVVAELTSKLNTRDEKFSLAVENEFNEVDLPDADAESLTKDLLA